MVKASSETSGSYIPLDYPVTGSERVVSMELREARIACVTVAVIGTRLLFSEMLNLKDEKSL